MLKLNNKQLNELLDILKRYQSLFILKQLGIDYLSQSERDVLAASGIDLAKYANATGVIEHAFLFGLLSEAIEDERAKKMDYAKFKKFLKTGAFLPLTEQELFALEQVKNRAYTDISGLGSRMLGKVSNIVIQSNTTQQYKIQELIKKKTIEAVKFRYTATQLAAELGEATQDWERDWLRIAYYLTHEAYNVGRGQSIFKQYGGDSEIYFDVYTGACKHCLKLYLTNPEDETSEPIVFKLKDVLANGNNIGRKVDEYMPTLSPVHPYCRCTVNYKKPGMGWDSSLRAFVIPTKVISSKLKGVKLNIKVSK